MANKDIEIPFGAYDSELGGFEYTIPEGYKAEIKDGKVVVKKTESEDEKIRKAIYNCVKWFGFDSCFFKDVSQEECLDWLEKQGEQKLYVNDNAKEMFIKALERVEEQNNKGYKLTDCDKNSWWEDFKAYTSCTIEQKPAAWSEEDERKINYLIALLQNSTMNDDALRVMNEEVENWLKSLRPQNRWKPNEEQMDALRYVTNFDYGGHKATLVSLYEQLKKLKE